MKSAVFTITPSSAVYSHTVDEALDIIGRGRFQYYVFISCGIFLMATIIEIMGVSYIMAPAVCDLELDTFRKGILSSVTFLGIALSSHFSGFLADEYGRKTTASISLIISMTLSLSAALVPGYWTIVVLRLLSGISIAAASNGAYAYLSEFFPSKMRASSISYASAIASLSITYMPIVGIVINRLKWEMPITEDYNLATWRIHMMLNLIPACVALFLMHRLPESPKYLIIADRREECLKVLSDMYEANTKQPEVPFPVNRITPVDGHGDRDSHSNKSIKGFVSAMLQETKEMFSAEYVGLVLKCCFIQIGCFIIAGGFGLWFPELSNRFSSDNSHMGICEIISPTEDVPFVSNHSRILESQDLCSVEVHEEMFTNNMALGFCYTISFLLLGFGLDKLPLKNTLVFVMLVGMSCCVLVQHIRNSAIMLIVFCLMIISCGVSIPLVNATAVDLFPTHLRGMAISISAIFGRLGSVGGTNSLGFLLEFDCGSTFYLMAILMAGCVFLGLCLPRKNFINK